MGLLYLQGALKKLTSSTNVSGVGLGRPPHVKSTPSFFLEAPVVAAGLAADFEGAAGVAFLAALGAGLGALRKTDVDCVEEVYGV